jgi:glycosyltransferase involved in cell wall biosynthesis
MFFSVIIPIYNRPQELEELLLSLTRQTYHEFEVVVIEDGSDFPAEKIVYSYQNQFPIRYIFQTNQGQGFARNTGMHQAKGDFFIILDSDVILPAGYLAIVADAIESRNLDSFGGPDAASSDFSILQKAMDFAMTSFWTTGGIRGKLKDTSKYQARGFNMGVSKAVFQSTQGFIDPNRGEDIEWSIRIKKEGYKLELVEEAFVYHKRKNNLFSFAKQAFSFGRNRVNVSRFHPEAIKMVHLLPTGFALFLVFMLPMAFISSSIFNLQLLAIVAWLVLIFFTAVSQYRSVSVALLSLLTSMIQLICYGTGLLLEWILKMVNG